MRKLMFGGLAAAISLATVSAPASAQLSEWEDYEYSDTVTEMTTVRVEPGQLDTYLAGLEQTWVAANDVAMQLGHITDYKIYANMAPGGEAFHLLLLVEFPGENMQPSRERYDEFMAAWGEANMDSSNETVVNVYNEIREITGVYMAREITMTD
ncbi:hypothetical protein [Aurantiacibacter poecillastricola]|uniref:hypothetical protein n=1 Tax=Aurantiacibacter poecillastricola TaxID=3064385 RepID=UPI00273E91E2|nr:hypothetical protein [Aurantiacibacter sp. 219JJ12-13]MDP5261037.1 hypothetical protein [Aurantiacibacter sp. 219JJ12-13]